MLLLLPSDVLDGDAHDLSFGANCFVLRRSTNTAGVLLSIAFFFGRVLYRATARLLRRH